MRRWTLKVQPHLSELKCAAFSGAAGLVRFASVGLRATIPASRHYRVPRSNDGLLFNDLLPICVWHNPLIVCGRVHRRQGAARRRRPRRQTSTVRESECLRAHTREVLKDLTSYRRAVFACASIRFREKRSMQKTASTTVHVRLCGV